MASRNIEDCDIRLQNVWSAATSEWNTKHPDKRVVITCTYRSPEEQDALYAQGRTTEGKIVTKAMRFQSPHNFLPAQAFDVAFRKADGTIDWSEVLFAMFAAMVFKIDPTIVWGGMWKSFRDNPHFETPDWRNMRPSA